MKANLDKNLAPAWVSGKSYSTGEFCLYNKRLYICTTDNSDAEFDNSKWERRNLVDLVSGGNSNLGNEVYEFNEVVSTFDYQQSSVTFDATIGAIYEVVNSGYQGAQSQDISISSGATLIKKLTCSSNAGCCVMWLKATDTTVVLDVSNNNNIGCILKCSKTHIPSITKLTTLVYIGWDEAVLNIPASSSGYSMFLAIGYQGAQYHGFIPSSLKDTSIEGITCNTGYKTRGLSQWNLKTTKPYSMLGIQSNSRYWYAY